MWRVYLEYYTAENLEILLEPYYQEFYRIQDWIYDIQARADNLTYEYNQNKEYIKEKQYNI